MICDHSNSRFWLKRNAMSDNASLRKNPKQTALFQNFNCLLNRFSIAASPFHRKCAQSTQKTIHRFSMLYKQFFFCHISYGTFFHTNPQQNRIHDRPVITAQNYFSCSRNMFRTNHTHTIYPFCNGRNHCMKHGIKRHNVSPFCF